ncbi:Nramp family divalent metal transporter [Aquisphaera insulae]|uniref:Nramp family divalent metal transporter n=1 Tax=Aquisphaera insulae TaxID=2712864 RepID=UPI0013E9D5E5|nr:Nramp family divalent metal transporter [Aquisphaera insulae]
MFQDNQIPAWTTDDLAEPKGLSWRNWASFIGPGIVMMGIQIGGGEWLLGPTVTARYGGSMMWIATVAIVVQVFYNLECGRYALYCGEPVFTGFMRCRPGPLFWVGVMLTLNVSALVPGLSTHGAAMIAALILDRPPTPDDRWLVTPLAYACLLAVALPVLLGGKVYNVLQAVMTAKVVIVLGFCLAIGATCVGASSWWNVFSGFLKFGNVPVGDGHGGEVVANGFAHLWATGEWPVVSTASIVVLGAFAGYAGGGGLANSTYSNFVRDKGWGMGGRVGAIPSAIGGRNVALSHVGKVFPLTSENLRRWRGWWRYVLTDQVLIWAPGCFMGMALPALLSMQFAHFSTITPEQASVAQSTITADGLRHAASSPMVGKLLWIAALFTGLVVMLPSQMSIVDDFSRRWTDAIWSASRRVRATMEPHQVKFIYYSILGSYVLWSFACAYYFSNAPRLMTDFIANFNNLAIGVTSFQLLWINLRLLPPELRPRWYHVAGVLGCGVFYLGLAALVFVFKIWPYMTSS